jgi:hypothetical protein
MTKSGILPKLLLENIDFWAAVINKGMSLDTEEMRSRLLEDFSSIKEVLSEPPFTRTNAIAGEQNQRGLR